MKILFAAWSLLVPLLLAAQVPHLITYQGRVNSAGEPFSGTGQFKFALVGPGGAPVFWRNDGAGGAGEPSVAVNIPVTNGLFNVILGDSTLPGMAVLPSGVFSNSAVFVRIWFNDGVNGFAQLAPDQRLTAVAYALTADGVRAGAITSASIAPGAVDASKLAAGAAVSNLLASGRSSLVSGGVILSAQEHATNLLNEGYVKLAQVPLVEEKWRPLTNGPPLFQTALERKGHAAVWTGSEMIIWGGQNDTTPFNTGGRYNPATDTWTAMSTNGAPSPQTGASAVWTGTMLVVWGNSGPVRGGRYNPATDTWSPMSTNNGPGPRASHSVAWTGTYMILWGGTDGNYLNTGFRYNPATDTWSAVSSSGLAIRGHHSAVWTGTEMIIWGGSEAHSCGLFCFSRTNYNDGARYNPTSNTWLPVNVATAPSSRDNHGAVWTGTEMLIWGGKFIATGIIGMRTNYNSGSRYNPTSNTWTPMTQTGAPSPRESATMLWTGSRVVIWGGVDEGGTNLNNGSRYNPANNTWLAVTNANQPAPRNDYTAVWSGTEMLVWGGELLNEPGTFDDEYVEIGYRYNPASDAWTTMSPSGEPAARFAHTAIWTGREMIVWGGDGGEFLLRTGGKLDPTLVPASMWSAISSTGAPSARIDHTAVWSGSQMLVWGGADSGGGALNTGGRYNLSTDSWTAITTNGAPLARRGHVAAWTGTEMLIWGGNSGGTYYNTGGRYNPLTGTWTALPVAGAPTPRSGATAVWTGTEMIVWGGVQITAGFPPTFTFFNTGARYNPASNSWSALPAVNAPVARANHTAVWTGSDMIVWGGLLSSPDIGGRYNRAANTWTPLPTLDVPASRTQHAAVWDGTQMIVWGGHNGTNEIATGATYDPSVEKWHATTMTGAPIQRVGHTAVWAGTEMVVWGGRYSDLLIFDDALGYTPPRTMFLYLKP